MIGFKDYSYHAIGIDLGTSYSCVGVYKNGRFEIIPNEFGHKITPSYVALTDDETLIGDQAKFQAHSNNKLSAYAIKRLLGRNYDEL